jgi:putative addiction module killer protein
VKIKKTPEFSEWMESLQIKPRAQVEARLHRIEVYGFFGDAKSLGDSLAELRWTNGLRVYFCYEKDQSEKIVIVLLGGIKNAQEKDIKKARVLIRRIRAD